MKIIFRFLLRTVFFLFLLLNIITAFHAYKFTHFYDADEVVLKNTGDKNKWDITKEILFGINAVKQKNQEPDSSFETIILTTKDSIKLEAWYVKIKSSNYYLLTFTICMWIIHPY